MILNREVYFSHPLHKRLLLFFSKFFYILFRFLGRPNWGRLNAGGKLDTERQSLFLTVSDDGSLECISCDLCAQICPTNCLELSAPPEKETPCAPAFFHFEPLSCIYCNLCVEVCPEDAIAFSSTGRTAGHSEEVWGKDLHHLAFRAELNEGSGVKSEDSSSSLT
jgi:formate hydrogenlyase subunit 6/NADH:ubiquinone oxidoreductase subunit I